MKDEDGYRTREVKLQYLKKIKKIEADLINKKMGATTREGHNNYDFVLMMNATRYLLNTTKSLEDDEHPIPPFPDDDLTVGDVI